MKTESLAEVFALAIFLIVTAIVFAPSEKAERTSSQEMNMFTKWRQIY